MGEGLGLGVSSHLNTTAPNRCKCDKNRLVATTTLTTFATFRTQTTADIAAAIFLTAAAAVYGRIASINFD